MDRNLIIALVLSLAFFLLYDLMILQPQRQAYEQSQEAARIEAEQAAQASGADTSFVTGATPAGETLSREEALARAPGRVPIRTGELEGSINLRGLLFDDLTLTDYRVSLDEDADPVVLLSPMASPAAQYMRAGTVINNESDANAVWEAPEGAVLTETSPVTFSREQGGIVHEVIVSIDEHFMFTIDQTIRNESQGAAVALGYGAAYQQGIPPDLRNMMILFEGPLSVVDGKLYDKKYKKLPGMAPIEHSGTGGWVGLTDKYWLSAAIPPQDRPFKSSLSASDAATPLFRASYVLDPVTVPQGETLTIRSHLFGGAKDVSVLKDYQRDLGIDRFDWAVDWGNFSFLTRPIFNLMAFFHDYVGNWGVAILLLTLVIKAVLFPLANLSYKSMAGMKKVQPEMKKIQERYKDDNMKKQQEMMALYKKHKINPAAGCLPILAQMPIFYALYKTLFVTIELRHEPFLYIQDLSERDPAMLFNLFGLLPYNPAAVPVFGIVLGIGFLPLLMGAAMFVQTKLNPPPPDPTQRMIFGLMPLIFMFILAPFAAGLVLYWFWNTLLSVIQQYVIMKRQGADVDIFGNIRQSFGKGPETANENKAK